jgi:response regulator RpfG family c-di-GMP phosphodiesterase
MIVGKLGSTPPTLLLLSDDPALVSIVGGIITHPWGLVRDRPNEYWNHKVVVLPNVRLVIFDDETVEENDRGWVLAQIRKHFSGRSLIYVANSHTEHTERKARTCGAHYYISKPLSPEQFGEVLLSFLQVRRARN